MMDEAEELRRWITRAFEAACALPPKTKAKARKPGAPGKRRIRKRAR
jgi:hypothetical protein